LILSSLKRLTSSLTCFPHSIGAELASKGCSGTDAKAVLSHSRSASRRARMAANWDGESTRELAKKRASPRRRLANCLPKRHAKVGPTAESASGRSNVPAAKRSTSEG